MKYLTILALSAPWLALCKPMAHERLHHNHHIHKRDDSVFTSYNTVWIEVTETIDVTVTVWIQPPAPDNGKAKAADINLNVPNSNPAKPTPQAPAAPVVHQVVQQPSTTPPPPPKATPAPAPQAAAPVQQQVQPPSQPAQQQPAQQQPAQQQPAQQQPQQQQPTQQASSGSSGGSAPTGGTCGDVGGKCMASDVTIYNDQGTGACGWANDTNSEDYFALSYTQWNYFTNDAPGPHKNVWCGRMATISAGGKQVTGMLTDKCPGCAGWSIDLSQSLWNKVFPGQANTRNHDIEWWFSGPQVYNGPGS